MSIGGEKPFYISVKLSHISIPTLNQNSCGIWKNTFQTLSTIKVVHSFTTLMEETMARLQQGEREEVSDRVHCIVRSRYAGLRETEIAQMAQMDRRRLNNYLRDLESSNKIYREGRLWFAK
jgi:hypothetical protein